MKIYITKPAHIKYGKILLNRYSSIDKLLDDCTVWFNKPFFRKPVICFLTDQFIWYGFDCGLSDSYIKLKHLPEGEVKDKLKELVKTSLNFDLSESLPNRHYKWMGTLDIEMTITDETPDLTLYLTKPSIWDIQFAGIDRARIWFTQPVLTEVKSLYPDDLKRFELSTGKNNYLSGKVFRKVHEFEDAGLKMWQAITNTFTVSQDNIETYYDALKPETEKQGMTDKEFIVPFHFKFKLRSSDEN